MEMLRLLSQLLAAILSLALAIPMTHASGTTNYVQYDSRGRLLQLGKPAGLLQYGYDLAGNLTRLSTQTNVNYSYL